MSPDRRAVLKGLGAAVVAAGGGVAAWQVLGDDETAAPPPTTDPLPTPEPASTLGDALVAVGTRYLEEVPEEADRQVLLDALPPLDGQVPERPGQALRVLEPLVVEDHAAGRVVALDGWVLSRTECRAAALYAV